MNVLASIVYRDCLLAMRRKSEALLVLVFFIVINSLFPLVFGSDAEFLKRIGAGALWISALLAMLLEFPRYFWNDFLDGTLEEFVLSPCFSVISVGAKIFASWLLCGLPLILVTPLIAIQYGLPSDSWLVLIGALLLGTIIFTFLGSLGASLTLGSRGAGALIAVIMLPLCVPILFFGVGATDAVLFGQDPQGYLSLLGALCLFFLLIGPWMVTYALKISLES